MKDSINDMKAVMEKMEDTASREAIEAKPKRQISKGCYNVVRILPKLLYAVKSSIMCPYNVGKMLL